MSKKHLSIVKTLFVVPFFVGILVCSFSLLVYAATAAPTPVAAPTDTSTGFKPLTDLAIFEQFGNSQSLPNVLNNIYKICIGLAAVIAVLQLMRAGLMYMGGDSITEKKDARHLIVQTLYGLLLVLSPAIVFGLINPKILSLQIGNLNQLNIQNGASSSGTSAQNVPGASTCTESTLTVKQVNGNSCSSLGTGYVARAECCSNVPQGSTCCVFDSAVYGNPSPQADPNPYYYTTIVKISRPAPQLSCLQTTESKHFSTKEACSTSINQFLLTTGTQEVVTQHDCNGPVDFEPRRFYDAWVAAKYPAC